MDAKKSERWMLAYSSLALALVLLTMAFTTY